MTLEEAIDKLRHQESFQLVAEEIASRLNDSMRDLPVIDADKVDRTIGKIAAYQEILDTFGGA